MTTEKDKHPCDIESTLSVDQLAHLLVELSEEPENNNASPTLNTRDSLSEVASPNEPTEAAIRTEQRKFNERVKKLHNDGYISQSTLQYLMAANDATAGRFYLLPKMHKKNCPGRPVISGCNTPTEKISAFVPTKAIGIANSFFCEGHQPFFE